VLSQLQFLLPWVSEPTRRKLGAFISAMPEDQCGTLLVPALTLGEFQSEVRTRIQQVQPETLKAMINNFPADGLEFPLLLVDRATTLYEESLSFDTANARADDLIRPLLKLCTPDQLRRIVRAYEHSQVSGSFRFKQVLKDIKLLGRIPPAEFNELLNQSGVSEIFPEFLYEETA
jgi:hypothetical protein